MNFQEKVRHMPYRDGRGRGFGSGWGRESGFRFGFRGASPLWSYVGIGRGGLPRHAWFTGATVYPPPVMNSPAYGDTGCQPEIGQEEELNYLKSQAEAIKDQLSKIESRMKDLEKEQT